MFACSLCVKNRNERPYVFVCVCVCVRVCSLCVCVVVVVWELLVCCRVGVVGKSRPTCPRPHQPDLTRVLNFTPRAMRAGWTPPPPPPPLWWPCSQAFTGVCVCVCVRMETGGQALATRAGTLKLMPASEQEARSEKGVRCNATRLVLFLARLCATTCPLSPLLPTARRHKTLSDLTSALRDSGLFTHVAELPIMAGDGAAEAGGGGGRVPLDVLQHVAAGLRDVNERNKPQLPVEWEARARELLLRPDTVAALQGLQRGMPEVRADMQRALEAAIRAAREAAAAGGGDADASGALVPAPSLSSDIADLAVEPAAAAGGGATAAAAAATSAPAVLDEDRVAYFSVAGLDEEALRAAARAVLPEPLHSRLRRGALHVTLWHRWGWRCYTYVCVRVSRFPVHQRSKNGIVAVPRWSHARRLVTPPPRPSTALHSIGC